MKTIYTIKQGDTLTSIGRRFGITWQKIYNHLDNSDFRKKRPNPNLILPGDVLVIPQPEFRYYEVPGMGLIPQTKSLSCWYASAQMLINWKMNKVRMSLKDLVLPQYDAECRKIRDANGGILNNQILSMAKRLGLRAVPPMSPTTETLEMWLRQYGPLWVNGKQHIVVIAGINGMRVKIYDPWPIGMGKIDWRSLQDWYVGGKNPKGQPDSSRDSAANVETVFLYCP